MLLNRMFVGCLFLVLLGCGTDSSQDSNSSTSDSDSTSFQVSSEINPFSVILEARIKDYIDLLVNLTYLILFVFQIQFCIILGLFFNLFTINFCVRHRRYFLLFSWIVAALVTPPDVLSQIFIAIPLYFLIELTFFSYYCFVKQ